MRHFVRAFVPEYLYDSVVLGKVQPFQQGGHRQLVRPFGQVAIQTRTFVHVGGMVGAYLDEGRVARLVGMVLFEVGQQVKPVVG